jgi:hypothetical protein
MQFPRWKPGLAGLIYLPRERTYAGQRDRPYDIYNVDKEGKCKFLEGYMNCDPAGKRMEQLAAQAGKTGFGCPIDRRLQSYRANGYLNCD